MLRILRTAALILACLALLGGIAFYFARDTETAVVELPAPPAESANAYPEGDLGQGRYTRAAVTPDTVQTVVGKTLRRAENYSRTVTVERFWDGGSAVETIECHIRGADAHLIVQSRGDARHVLLTGGTAYIWYGDTVLSYAAAPAEAGMADDFTGILTYEALLSLDSARITDAGYTTYGGKPCIYAADDAGRWLQLHSLYFPSPRDF
jgi:hypothetical protein